MKTIKEINEKISKNKAVVLTAEEVSELSKTVSYEEIAEKIDVVTTATFGAMCSSGAFINFGHTSPAIRIKKAWLNNVPAYSGIAAVDAYIGATEESESDNTYGGANVICELVEGKDIKLDAIGTVTDCYPKKEVHTFINKDKVNEIILHNPRNAYQNYAAATNSTTKVKYTYMGVLLPNNENITYSTSGELSPLLNDPKLLTIGIGTRIFLGGAQGYITWNGTQFNTQREEINSIPIAPARTLSVTGNLKEMSREFMAPAYFKNYGVSFFIGIGVPIPILNSEIAKYVSIKNKDIFTNVLDYGSENHTSLGKVNYEELRSGKISFLGKTIKTAPLSSLYKARKIADILKKELENGNFYLTKAVANLPQKASIKSLS